MAQGWGLALSYPYLRINTSLPVFPHSSRISLLSLLALREASPHRVVGSRSPSAFFLSTLVLFLAAYPAGLALLPTLRKSTTNPLLNRKPSTLSHLFPMSPDPDRSIGRGALNWL